MQSARRDSLSRRDFLKNTGRVAAATTLAASMVPAVHAAENNTIQVALIGCGGRGSGAVGDAVGVNRGPLKLVAMADVFEDRLNGAYHSLTREFGDRIDVPRQRRFVGFDAYRKAMDCLKPGDIAIFATPLAFRWIHFAYAIEKKLNVFMEKPLTADGPSSRKMFKLAEEATAKNLKVGVGLMSRHSRAMQELAERIHGGEIGEIVLMRGYRMHVPLGSMLSGIRPDDKPELEYQIRRFHSFLWASGGCFSDFLIHTIDHCCWMKNAWPVQAIGLGGRHYRGDYVDQNFDIYAVEYTFPDETKFIMDGRYMPGCQDIFHSAAHGTKGTAVVSNSGDCGGPSATFQGVGPFSPTFLRERTLRSKPASMRWESKGYGNDAGPYRNEWNDLVEAIRNDTPYNEVKRGVEASLVTSMGRMSAHTGRVVTFSDMLNCSHEFAPGLDKIVDIHEPAPLAAGPNKRYPVPQPGIVTHREYA